MKTKFQRLNKQIKLHSDNNNNHLHKTIHYTFCYLNRILPYLVFISFVYSILIEENEKKKENNNTAAKVIFERHAFSEH